MLLRWLGWVESEGGEAVVVGVWECENGVGLVEQTIESKITL